MNYIITKNKKYFEAIGNYNYCNLEDMVIPYKIAIDTETTGLDCIKDKLFAVQIGTGENNYLIDLTDEKGISFKDIIPFIKDSILVGHNIGFDLGFFYKQGFFPDVVYDTMIGSMLLHNGDSFIKRHSFGFVMERELSLTYDKSEQKTIHKVKLSTARAIQYCFNDVDRLLELESNIRKKLFDLNSLETYKLNCSYLRGLTYMEMCGLPIDENYWKLKMEEDVKKKEKLKEEIIEYIYDNLPKYRDNQLNLFDTEKRIKVLLSSPKQVIEVFKDFGINIIDDEGKESIDEKVINKSTHEFVEIWLNFKEYQHRVTTFGETILKKVINGRLYTKFKPILDTCRIASRKGEINFLNFPSDKSTRDCFRAKKGYKMIVCDFDNQEAVTLADKSGNLTTLKTIKEGADSHSILAREVYPELKELTDDEIKKHHKDKRQIGKIANFTFAFGGSGYTAAKNLNIPLEEGDRIYEAYKKINKETFEWGEGVLLEALKTGYIESADGFKLKLPYFDDFRKEKNFLESISQEQWRYYKKGKEMYLEAKDAGTVDKILDNYYVQVYKQLKPGISSYFKRRSKYARLCLNNPMRVGA